MVLDQLQNTDNSRSKRKRLGRGTSSGHGKTSGKGHKGQNARSGGGVRPGFEGGQTPFYRLIGKIGFNNINKTWYDIVNLDTLEKLNLKVITPEILYKKKIVTKGSLVKILAEGTLTKAIYVKAHKFSAAAIKAIEEKNGKIEIIEIKIAKSNKKNNEKLEVI